MITSALKFGIVGARGHSARVRRMIRQLVPDGEVRIFSPSGRIASPLAANEIMVDSFETLLACDVLFICSPTDSHLDYLIKCDGRFPGFVFCEKPVVDAGQRDEMERVLSKSLRKRIYVNFHYIFDPFWRYVRKIAVDESLGRLISINEFASHGLAGTSKYRNSWRSRGGSVFNNIAGNWGSHYVRLFLEFLDEIVPSGYLSFSDSLAPKDTVNMFLEGKCPSGKNMHMNIFLSYGCPFSSASTVYFTNGIIHRVGNLVYKSTPRECFDESGLFVSPPSERIDLNTTTESCSHEAEALKGSIGWFLDQITNEKPDFSMSLDRALEVNTIMESMYAEN